MRIEVPKAERSMTRMDRYRERIASGKTKTLNVHAACINFGNELNYAHVLRAAACYGSDIVHLIGNYLGHRTALRAVSGTTQDIIETVHHQSPGDFVRYCRENNIKLVSLELPSESFGIKVQSLADYRFNFDDNQTYAVCTGGESIGIPIEILLNSDVVYIPGFGKSHCLNTSQAMNVGLYEYVRQYSEWSNK